MENLFFFKFLVNLAHEYGQIIDEDWLSNVLLANWKDMMEQLHLTLNADNILWVKAQGPHRMSQSVSKPL